MDLVRAANKYIPKSENRQMVTYPQGTTGDIVKEVLSVYEKCKSDLKDFAPFFKKSSILETGKTIWNFIKKNIRYQEDDYGVQWIKTPARIWQDRVCDCKGYSIFIGSILYNLGIPFKFRFVSFSPTNKMVTHVYIVAIDGTREIIIDDVLNEFNKQKAFSHKNDFLIMPTQIARLSGIGCDCNGNAVGRIPDYVSGIPSFKVPVNAQGNTTDELISKAILLERLEIEKAIGEKNAVIAGIGELPTADIYDATIAKLKNEINAEISGIQGIEGVGNIFKKIGAGIKKVAKAVVKVVTFPMTLPMKAIMEVALPQAAPGFMYLFIYPEFQGSTKVDLLSKVPDKVKKKAEKQRKLKDFVQHAAGFKESHVIEKIRNGILKKYGKQPEALIAEKLGIKISGPAVGAVWGAIIGFVITLIQKIVGLFKKKKPDVTPEESVPDENADFAENLEAVNTSIVNLQNVETNTASTVKKPDPVLTEQVKAKEKETVLAKVLQAAGAVAQTVQQVQQVQQQTQQQAQQVQQGQQFDPYANNNQGGYQVTANETQYYDPQAAYNSAANFTPTAETQSVMDSKTKTIIIAAAAGLAALLLLKKK